MKVYWSNVFGLSFMYSIFGVLFYVFYEEFLNDFNYILIVIVSLIGVLGFFISLIFAEHEGIKNRERIEGLLKEIKLEV